MAIAVVLLLWTHALATTGAAQPSPQRIVSLNLCVDQILIDLVPRARIAALSHLAADVKVSPIAGRVGAIPLTRGEAEDVLSYEPDLVIAGTWSTPATVALLNRMGRRVETVPLASDIAGIDALIVKVATAVGETVRGAQLIAELHRRIRAARPSGPAQFGTTSPSALVYQVNGLASGTASLADAVMRASGFRNLASDIDLGTGGQVSLEALVANPPDLLILTGPVDEYRTAVAANLRHPALAALREDRITVELPWRHWLCGTHHVATAIEQLAAARSRIQDVRP